MKAGAIIGSDTNPYQCSSGEGKARPHKRKALPALCHDGSTFIEHKSDRPIEIEAFNFRDYGLDRARWIPTPFRISLFSRALAGCFGNSRLMGK
jgi:hypothetical protein